MISNADKKRLTAQFLISQKLCGQGGIAWAFFCAAITKAILSWFWSCEFFKFLIKNYCNQIAKVVKSSPYGARSHSTMPCAPFLKINPETATTETTGSYCHG
jgi:hypothetical protein